MALKSFRLLHLSLSEIVESDHAVFVSSKHQLVVVGKVGINSRCNFVVGEDASLNLLALHVKHSELVVSAPSYQHGLRSPRH